MPPPNPTAFSSASSPTSVPRRRQRVDSSSDVNPDPSNGPRQSRPDLKRPRSDLYAPPATSTASATTTATTMSAKVQGKRPEVIDLTRQVTPPMQHPHHHPHQQHLKHSSHTPSLFSSRSSTPLQPHVGSRKLVVKNLRPPTAPRPTAPAAVDSYYAGVRADLDAALSAIFAGRPTPQPMERLYRGVEDICRKGEAAELTERLRARCEAWLNDGQGEMLGGLWARYAATVGAAAVGGSSSGGGGGSSSDGGVGEGAGDALLRGVVERWKRWGDVLFVVRGLYSYLDRAYLLLQGGGGGGKQGVNEMGIELFRKAVFGSRRDPNVAPQGLRVLEAVCRMVDYVRRGDERQDEALLKEAVAMLRLCGVYGRSFEPMFLVKSHRYLEAFAAEMSAMYGLKGYISAVGTLLQKESDRCDGYNFESTTKKQLLEDAHHVLIEQYSDKLLDSGSVGRLLEAGDVESVKALYELLKLSGLQKRLKGPWERYVRDTGAAIVSDTQRGDDMVIRLLELRRSLDIMIRDAFAKDEVFVYGLRESFGHFINDKKSSSSWNTGTSKVGEMIAKYIDMLLRGGLKTLPKSLLSDSKDRADAEMSGVASTGDEDAELDRQLDYGLELFRFIEGKDVFEAFYKKDLARRLLLGRSASQDAERSMLAKLKSECGSSFTHNLEQMFKDQELAKDEMTSYKEWLAGTGRSNGGVDLSVSILSAAAWPTFPDVRVLLPKEVLEQITIFDKYYKNKHTGRRLTWKHNMAHCVVKAQFNRGPKELLVSALQAAVLMLFNDVEDDGSKKTSTSGVLSYEQISQATGLQGGELDRTLQSLACGKARVLTKHPKGRDVSPTDTFTVNKAFTDPKFRVKINQIQLKETKEENRETHARVAADRQFETQAAIVRIMKSRKKMGHVQLVAEVINQTRSRGAVDPADIKANIEKLIEKDYLEREGGYYIYLA
ncbi:Cullin-4B [Madurella mycetomatis]|uniref:Cullin-4B n=1 Tax=Madurella mycetomatis TaxID=100816 RepID=A0A175VYT8_9PEZI|nr:Cullin-4B [Madurella mycetomatis]